MKYKGVLFDLDGTVLDSVDDIAAALNRALESHGFPCINRIETEAFLGNGTRRLVEQALPVDCPEDVKEDVIAEYKGIYEIYCHRDTRPYEGMVELMKELKAGGIKTAVVSNKPDSMVQTLEKVYYPGVPDLVMGEKAGLARKPAADMIYATLDKLALRAEDCVYVGDTEVDLMTARNSGMDCIAVSWGFRGRELLEKAGAARIADNVEELISML